MLTLVFTLRSERDALEATRPPIVANIILLAAGIVCAVPGFFIALLGLTSYLPGVTLNPIFNPVVLVVLGLVLLAGGATSAIIGWVTLAPRSKRRREIGEQLNVLDAQLAELAPPEEEKPSDQTTGGLRLLVIDRATGAGVVSASVKIGPVATETDVSGRVAVGGLPRGARAARAEAAGRARRHLHLEGAEGHLVGRHQRSGPPSCRYLPDVVCLSA